MKLHATYCSKDKKKEDGKIPAVQRYSSDRIQKIFQTAKKKDEKFAILSGKYGLLKAGEKIPYYDKLLRKQDIEKLVPKVRKFLREEKISEVIYHTKKVEGQRVPYFQLIKKSCGKEDVNFQIREIQ